MASKTFFCRCHPTTTKDSRCWAQLQNRPISSRGVEMQLISRHVFDTTVVLFSFLDITSVRSKRDSKLASVFCLELASPIIISWRSSNQGMINIENNTNMGFGGGFSLLSILVYLLFKKNCFISRNICKIFIISCKDYSTR